MKSSEKYMTVIEHLEELRIRLIVMLLAIAAASTGCWFLSVEALKLLLDFVQGNVQVLGMTDAFMVRLKVSIALGAVLASPVVIHQIWAFIAPGLKPHEWKYASPVIIAGILLFFLGAAFALVIIPFSIRFFEKFGAGVVEYNYTLDKLVSYISGFVLSFGAIFQAPVILFFLAKIGIVNHRLLASNRKYAVIICVALGAIITPDPLTNMIVALPLYLLFEASLLVVRLTEKPSEI